MSEELCAKLTKVTSALCSYLDHADMLVPLVGVDEAPAAGGSAGGVSAGDEDTTKAPISVPPPSGGGAAGQDAAPALPAGPADPQPDQVKMLEAFRLTSS